MKGLKMKTNIFRAILLFCFFVCLNYAVFSFDKLNFRLERLSTDYNGVVYDGRTVLAYGKYGVITYSTNQGETWEQISIGDSLDILKVVTIDGNFYALTPYSLLKSTGNVLNWKQRTFFDEPKFKDFTFDDKFLYLATENVVYRIDLGWTGELETLFEFDEFSSLSEIVYLNSFLFCIDMNYFILRLNLQSKEIDTIDIHQTILRNVTEVRNISHLKVYGSTLYLLVESIDQNNPQLTQPENADRYIRHYLLKSDDEGNSWEVATRNIRLSKEYQLLDGIIYFLTHKGTRDTTTNEYYYTVRYFKINPDGNEEEINKSDLLTYRIPIFVGGNTYVSVPNTFRVNMFVRTDNGTLIAVGPNKTILKSKNDGQNWDLISYFKPIGEYDGTKVKFLGRDTVLVFSSVRPFFFKSFDGGVTFVPPKREVENFPESGGTLVIWDDAAFGFIVRKSFTHTEKINDSTDIIKSNSTYFYLYNTTDLGESFSKRYFYRSHLFTSDSVWYWLEKVAVTQGKVLCVFSWYRTKAIDTALNCYFYLFDKSFNPVDSIIQDKRYYFYRSNILIEDSIIYYLRTPSLYFSKDFGRNWEEFYSSLPPGDNAFEQHFKNYILISNRKQIGINKYEYKLLKFNLFNSVLDTFSSTASLNFFAYNDTLLAYILDNKFLYFFPLGIDSLDIYDSVEVFAPMSEKPSFIVDAVTNGEDWYFLLLKENGSGFLNRLYELNLAKVVYGEPKYLPVEPQLEKGFVYLYNFPPYPMPARDYFTSRLYWDLPYTANDINVTIYDIFGNKQEGVKAELISINSYSGMLRVDCSIFPDGVYTAVLSLAGKTLSIPFVVIK